MKQLSSLDSVSLWRSSWHALAVALLLLGAAYAYLLWSAAEQRARLAEQAGRDHVVRHSAVLARALNAPLADADRSAVLDILLAQRRSGALTDAAVYDSSQRLLAALGPQPPGFAATDFTATDFTATDFTATDFTATDFTATAAGGASSGWLTRPIGDGEQPLGWLRVHYPRTPAPAWSGPDVAVAVMALLAAAGLLASLLWPIDRALSRLQHGLGRLRRGDWDADIDAGGVAAGLSEQLRDFVADEKSRLDRLHHELQQQRQESRRLNLLLRESAIAVWEADPSSAQFSYISATAESLLGHSLSVWLESSFIDVYVHPNDREWLRECFQEPGSEHDHFCLDVRIRNAASEWRWLEMSCVVERREQGLVPVGLLRDASEEKLSQQKLAHVSDHDELTGLLVRRRWRERCQLLIDRQSRGAGGAAVLRLRLAGFAALDGLLGPAAADDYLRELAQILTGLIENGETLGRLGDDEFGLLLSTNQSEEIERRALHLRAELGARDIDLGGHSLPLGVDIGAAQYPNHGFQLDELLRNAGIALAAARRGGGFVLYADSEAGKRTQLLETLGGWRRQLQQDRLKPLFQPLVELRSGRIHYYDVQMPRPEGIDAFERDSADLLAAACELFGVDEAAERLAIRDGLRRQHAVVDPGNEPRLLLRLCGRRWPDPALWQLLAEQSRLYKISPGLLTVGFAAAAVADRPGAARGAMRWLREMGHQIALHGFGRGELGPSELAELPLDLICLDAQLVRRLDWSQGNRIWVKAVVEAARGANVPVVAPEVEDEATLQLLRRLGVRFGQGALFAPPERRFHELGRVVISAQG